MRAIHLRLAVVGTIAIVATAAAVLAAGRGQAAIGPTGTCTVGFGATSGTSSGYSMAGQSFTACANGVLTSIDFQYSGPVKTGKTLRIFDGNSVSGTPLYTQSGVTLTGVGYTHITLSAMFQVVRFHQYTFQVDQGTGIGFGGPGLLGQSAWFDNYEFTDLSIGHWVHIATKLSKA